MFISLIKLYINAVIHQLTGSRISSDVSAFVEVLAYKATRCLSGSDTTKCEEFDCMPQCLNKLMHSRLSTNA